MEVPKLRDSCPEKKLIWLQSQIIGASAEFNSPFGKRQITYADSTASGRSLNFIEDYIISDVLPFYGNTHTSDSYVGRHTTKKVEEAARYIKKCMGGGEEDVILFCGSGATAAIKRLQEVIGIAIASTLRKQVLQVLRNEERWVVFVGPYEHHSNLLSWRQSLAEVVEIGLSQDGGSIDMEALQTKLEQYAHTNRPMLGSFSACSNVTGLVTDTRKIARLLHQYGAFACFDFASSGPYVEINMRSGEVEGYDAIFVSSHKFIGGPGCPGILLMSNKLYQLTSSAPSTCGGGTVSYVNGFDEEDTLYLKNIEERENAGTPPIVQTIRAALAFWVKEYIGYKTIEEQEDYYMTKALQRLRNKKNIHILGDMSVKRLPILSFLIFPTTNSSITESDERFSGVTQKIERDKPLHGRFVATLLNDLFGVQARGGCACAGPYGHYLLDVDQANSLAIRSCIQKGYEGVKPGWTRICLPYYMSVEEFELVITAVEFVAEYGQRFLSSYDFNWKTGNWVFNNRKFEIATDRSVTKDTSCNSEVLTLSNFMKELRLSFKKGNKKAAKGNKVVMHTTTKEGSPVTNNCAVYSKTALYIASLLSAFPAPRNIPTDITLDSLDLPFMI